MRAFNDRVEWDAVHTAIYSDGRDREDYFWMWSSHLEAWGLFGQVATLSPKQLETMHVNGVCLFPPHRNPGLGADECVPIRACNDILVWQSKPRWTLTRLG